MELSEMLRSVIQVAPVIGVLAYGWLTERREKERWQERHRELDRLYRDTLRDLAKLGSEMKSQNGDLRQDPE